MLPGCLKPLRRCMGYGSGKKRTLRCPYKRKKTVRPNSAARRKFSAARKKNSAARKKFSASRSFFSAARSFEEVGPRASKGPTSSGWPCRCPVAKCGFGRLACRSGAARSWGISRPMRLRAGFFPLRRFMVVWCQGGGALHPFRQSLQNQHPNPQEAGAGQPQHQPQPLHHPSAPGERGAAGSCR